MPNLAEQLEADLITALKSRDEVKVSTLRLLKAALKNARIKKMSDLTEQDLIKVLRQEIKKRNDSVASYAQAKRQDLVDKEQAELKVLSAYLPAEMSDEDLTKIVDTVLAANSFTAKDFGQAMKQVVAEVRGAASGQRISALIKEKLK